MAETSPITPSSLAPLSSSLLACDALRSLLQTRTDMQEFLQWLLANDETGLLGSDFKLAIRNQILFDAAKKGWFARSNPSTGFLELVEFLPLASLDGSGSVEGDTLIFEGGVWITKSYPSIYLAATSGGATLPAATSGGILTVAHGLGVVPQVFDVYLECNSTDRGYAIGDKVNASGLMFFNGAAEVTNGLTSHADSTVVGAVFRGGGGGSYHLLDKGAFTRGVIDESKWNVRLYASL